jgi:hypothetical protein
VDAEHDDNLADAVALVTAVRAGESEGAAVIMASANWHGVCTALARLCADFLNEESVPDRQWRAWAAQQARRP